MQPHIDTRAGAGGSVVETGQVIADKRVADAHGTKARRTLGEHGCDGGTRFVAVAQFLEANRAQGIEPIALLPVMLAARLAALQPVAFLPAAILRTIEHIDCKRRSQLVEQAGMAADVAR